jgi:RimJ/RimL family protein N-acetyltransferase
MLASMATAKHEDFRRVRSPFDGALIRLRAVEEVDLPRINEAFWDPAVSRYLAMVWPQTVAGTREWWEGVRRNPGTAPFAIETLAGELVGVCTLEDISARNRSAEVGIWIGQPFWDHGYGTDALRALCRFGFQEMNLQRIFLRVYDMNPRARHAYEKAGFQEEGRLRRGQFVDGRYVDVLVMGLLDGELIE